MNLAAESRLEMVERRLNLTKRRQEVTPSNVEMICVTDSHVLAWLYYFEAP